MRRAAAGFTLLEVLLALLICTVGLLGFAGTLRPAASLAADGKARGRAALRLTSRISQLRSELLASAPACIAPAAGSSQSGSGIDESWSAALVHGMVELTITVSVPRSRGAFTDTLFTRLPCP